MTSAAANAATYYIDYNAVNDSANGTTKSTPWKRHPYMPGFSGSYSHAAGDTFYFKGGVTWPASVLPMTITQGGSSAAARDTYSSDVTWYNGGSWVRPILDGQYALVKLIGVESGVSHLNIMNLELKRATSNGVWGQGSITFGMADNTTISNLWIHDWTYSVKENAGGGIWNFVGIPNGITNYLITHCDIGNPERGNVESGGGCIWMGGELAYSKIHHAPNLAAHGFYSVHDNEFYAGTGSFDPQGHENVLYADHIGGWAPHSGRTKCLIYNNYIHNNTYAIEQIYPTGFQSGPVDWYIFNNVFIHNDGNGKGIDFDPEGGSADQHRGYVWNNTIEAGYVRAAWRSNMPTFLRIEIVNNHYITGGSIYSDDGHPVQQLYISNNLTNQTAAQAAAAGYDPNAAWKPTSVAAAGIGKALNYYSRRSDAVGIEYATTLAGTVEGLPRPTAGNWDIGAWQFENLDPTPPEVTSILDAIGQNGTPFSYQITASGFPTSFDAYPLPTGLSVNTTNGLISGTPNEVSVPYTNTLSLAATNALGGDVHNIQLVILEAQPTIAIFPATNFYLAVFTNTTLDRTFVVSNTAAAETTLTGHATNPTSPWTLVGNVSYSLVGQTSTNITLRYTPTTVGTNWGTVEFTGGYGSTNTLYGQGIPILTSPMSTWAGLVEDPFTTNAAGYISQSFQSGPEGGGTLLIGFNLPSNSTIRLRASIEATNTAQDSFYIAIDGQPVNTFVEGYSNSNTWDILPLTDVGAGFQDRYVHLRGNGTFNAPQFYSNVWTLAAGNHYVQVRGREANCRLATLTVESTAVSSAPDKVTQPTPGDGVVDVLTNNITLMWAVGAGSEMHFVYFGTDSTPDDTEFQAAQTSDTYALPTLAYSTLYYWRVDSSNSFGLTTGDVWSFTTRAAPVIPGQASSPSPTDTATNVALNVTLSWTAGANVESHAVYFNWSGGSIGPEDYIQNQLTNTFNPAGLTYGTTYRWRIDEVSEAGVTEGDEWSFTTVAETPPVVNPPTDNQGLPIPAFFFTTLSNHFDILYWDNAYGIILLKKHTQK